mgnify:CR=1 FL=1
MIGQTLGPYRIVEQIGLGGMATVYKAYHAAMDRFVAVKVLPPNMAHDPAFVARFAQEARTIAKLEHPYILPVYDSGSQEGTAYLVMRYMETGTLTDLLAKGRPDLRYTIRLVQHVAEALEHAHQHGIIHRDIKPSNILIDKNGQPSLTDFGISKIIEGSLNLTGSGIIGTPAYMSPEQGQGLKIDHRSDIYALGVVLYEMVTGVRPFEAETPMAVLLQHINAPLPPPRTLAPDIPPELERIILKALSKNPGDRHATAGHLARALENMISDSGRAAATVFEPVPSAQTAVERPMTRASTTRPAAAPPPPLVSPTARASQQAAQRLPAVAPAAPAPPKKSSRNWVLLLGCAGLLCLGLAAAAAAAYYFLPLTPPSVANVDITATFAAALTEAVGTSQGFKPTDTGAPIVGGTPPVASSPPVDATQGPPTRTPTSAPTETPNPTGCNDNGKYVADVTYPDNTNVLPNTPFTKTWRVQNTGTCPWDSTYSLKFVGGDAMSGPAAVAIPGNVPPNSTVDISVNLIAPAAPGTYTGKWRLVNPSNAEFGTNGNPLTVIIVVPATATPTATATATPTATATATTAAPAVTHSTAILTINSSFLADLDEGVITSAGADIWYHGVSAVERYIQPSNGAVLGIYGASAAGRDDCIAWPKSGDQISFGSLPVGTYVCYKTNSGRPGLFRVNTVTDSSITIGYTTWEAP